MGNFIQFDVENAGDVSHYAPTSKIHSSRRIYRRLTSRIYHEPPMQHDAGELSTEALSSLSRNCGFCLALVLTICKYDCKRTRQPLREPLNSPSVVYLHLLCDEGATNVPTEEYRHCAARQYTLSGFLRSLPCLFLGSIS